MAPTKIEIEATITGTHYPPSPYTIILKLPVVSPLHIISVEYSPRLKSRYDSISFSVDKFKCSKRSRIVYFSATYDLMNIQWIARVAMSHKSVVSLML